MMRWCAGVVLGLPPQLAVAADKDALFEAVRDCRTFVAEQSVEAFPEPGQEIMGNLFYRHEYVPEGTGFVVELTHSESDETLPATWACKIKNLRRTMDDWKTQGLQETFANATEVFPFLKPDTRNDRGLGDGGFEDYFDCADPKAPVAYTFRAHEAGSLYVNVSIPAVDAFACLDTVKLNDLLFACIYEFAAEPWAAYRADTGERHPPDRRGLTPERTVADVIGDKTIKRINTEEVEVQTDAGTVTLLRSDGPRVQCTIAALMRDETGTLVASDAADDADTVLWFMRGVSGFYEGFYFQPGAQGYYTCATSFPNVAILYRPLQLQNGDVTFSVAMEAVDADAYKQHC